MIKIYTAFLAVLSMFLFCSTLITAQAQTNEKQKINITLKVPYFNQITDLNKESMDYAGLTACGPTSLAIMLKYSGQDVDVNDVLKILPLEVYLPKIGFLDLSKGAKYFNREAVPVKFDHQEIYLVLEQGYPVFINIKNYDSGYGHGMVIIGMKGYDGKKAESLIAHDVWTKEYQEFKFNTYDTLIEPGKRNINTINKSNLFYIK
jgi:uncharacterized protein YvpB